MHEIMKTIKTLFVLCCIYIPILSHAQAENRQDEVTLTVSSDGATKGDAVKAALRSAIEQAYGTFVSANTSILNDSLVQDEIVTVASGNIKGYSEISSNLMPNGKTFVTLKTTVSISRLVSYAQSKGAETEFAGATFGMNIRMKELDKENEEKALKNMIAQLQAIPSFCDYKLVLNEPKVQGNMCRVSGVVYFIYNENTELFNDIVFNTLSSLSLSKSERLNYDNMELPYYRYTIESGAVKYTTPMSYNRMLEKYQSAGSTNFYLRQPFSFEYESLFNFVICDNVSSPTQLRYIKGEDGKDNENKSYFIQDYLIPGTYTVEYNKWNGKKKIKKHWQIGSTFGRQAITIYIPIKDIAEYSSFRAEASKASILTQ